MEHGKMALLNPYAGKEGDTDVENGVVGTVREGESGANGESSINIFK